MKLLQNVRELLLDRARAFKLKSIQSKHSIWDVMRTNLGRIELVVGTDINNDYKVNRRA